MIITVSLLISKIDLHQFAIGSPLAVHPSVISGCQCCICISMEMQSLRDETACVNPCHLQEFLAFV